MQGIAEIVERLQRMEEILCSHSERFSRIESTLADWRQTLDQASKKEQNVLRRKQYEQEKKRKQEGLLPLPDRNVLKHKDARIAPRVHTWALAGMRFGKADAPDRFFTWLVHQWNNCTYLRKPITFSGSSFKIWDGHHRYGYGPRDLMGYHERRVVLQVLRNSAELDDFQRRPWWEWCTQAVFAPVFHEMQVLGFASLPERFRTCCKLMMSGFGGHEVYTDLCWDIFESRENINRMLQRVGLDLQLMLRACFKGLRVKGIESPVPVPP